ncbi:Kelch-like protein 10 [Pestalotiopsis sp. IQ-011]
MQLQALFAAGLLSTALAHGDIPSAKEIQRRGAISRRCESAAGNFNKRRIASRMAKRWAGSGNTTYEVTAEAPYYDSIQNDTCILSPIVTEGPYIWPRSQTLRQDMSEGQPGVPLWLDIGVLDVNTCEPLPNVLLDFWNCNATGSYSSFTGLSPNTPFLDLLTELNITESDFVIGETDLHTDDTTWLRGQWPTDAQGMMEMKTTFPGFYVQRAVHIHIQAYTDWALSENGTVSTGHIASTGQLYFDESVLEQILALEPYASHTEINRTTNAEDTLIPLGEANGYSPMVSVVPADGENIENGMIGYITFGIDPSANGIDNSRPSG